MKKVCLFLIIALMTVVMVGCGGEENDGPITVENVDQPEIDSLEDGANPDIPGSLVDESIAKFPDTGLVNQFGEPVSFDSLPKKPIVIGFIYTRCPDADMCPLLTQKMQRIQNKLSKDSVDFVSVTFDPEYDTPTVLEEYGNQRGIDYENWDFWTGNPEVIDRLMGRFGIHPKKMENEIVHNMRTYLVDEDKTVRFWYRGTDWKVDDLVNRLESFRGREF